MQDIFVAHVVDHLDYIHQVCSILRRVNRAFCSSIDKQYKPLVIDFSSAFHSDYHEKDEMAPKWFQWLQQRIEIGINFFKRMKLLVLPYIQLYPQASAIVARMGAPTCTYHLLRYKRGTA